MATSLGQDGSGFSMAQCIFQYICGMDTSAIAVSIADIVDPGVKHGMEQVKYLHLFKSYSD